MRLSTRLPETTERCPGVKMEAKREVTNKKPMTCHRSLSPRHHAAKAHWKQDQIKARKKKGEANERRVMGWGSQALRGT